MSPAISFTKEYEILSIKDLVKVPNNNVKYSESPEK